MARHSPCILQRLTGPKSKIMMSLLLARMILNLVLVDLAVLSGMVNVMAAALLVLATGLGHCSVKFLIHGLTTLQQLVDAYQKI